MANPWKEGARGISPWTEARKILARKWTAAGLSRSQVANRLNEETGSSFSRSAVTRMCDRMGLGSPPRPAAEPQKRPKKRDRVSKLPAANPTLGFPRDAPPTATLVSERRLHLTELVVGVCRWPVGQIGDPEFYYCGADAAKPSSYCPQHHQIAYRRAA